MPPCHPPSSTIRNDCATRAQAGRGVDPTESGGPSGHDAGKKVRGRPKCRIGMVDLPDKAREVSKVFADGGTKGDRRRDRLKELKLPDIPEIVGKPEGRAPVCRRLNVEKCPRRLLPGTGRSGPQRPSPVGRHRAELAPDLRLCGHPVSRTRMPGRSCSGIVFAQSLVCLVVQRRRA